MKVVANCKAEKFLLPASEVQQIEDVEKLRVNVIKTKKLAQSVLSWVSDVTVPSSSELMNLKYNEHGKVCVCFPP